MQRKSFVCILLFVNSGLKSENHAFKHLAFLHKTKGSLGQDNLNVCKR